MPTVETHNIRRFLGYIQGSGVREVVVADLKFSPDSGGNPTRLFGHRRKRKLPFTRGTFTISTNGKSRGELTELVHSVKLRGKKEVAELGRQLLEKRANDPQLKRRSARDMRQASL